MQHVIVGSMIKSKVIGFNAKSMAAAMMENVVAEQNRRLVEYAKEKILAIGNQIQTYHSRNHMDRTGNLLNSLCWGVSYNGKLVEGGFFRDAVLNNKGIAKTSESFLHEWFSGDVKYLIPVNGRQLAQTYMQKYGNNGAKGWRVFFAILAPYWGYWEKGFTLIHGASVNPNAKKNGRLQQGYTGIRGATFKQFAVMTQFYDEIKKDLKPARVRFRVSVAKYNRTKLEKKWEKYAGL